MRIFGGATLCALLVAGGARAEQVALEDLVLSTKHALLTVQKQLARIEYEGGDLGLDFARADLSLIATLVESQKGKLSLYVLTVGGEQSRTASTRVMLSLRPPPRGAASDVSRDPISDALAEAILSAARAIDAARTGQPPLIPARLEAELSFALKRDGEAGFSIAFAPIGAGLGGGIQSGSSHSIKAVFEAPSEAAE